MSLLDHWRGLLAPFGAPLADIDAAHARLVALYADPQRHYHTLAHIETVLTLLSGASPSVELAAWLHDAVCDPRRSDNEERSAELARELLAPLGVPATGIAEVERLILLTKSHRAEDREGHLLLDADLAVLAAPEAEYDAYAAAIRREYDWVSEADYREGRAAVLARFLARPRIYHHLGRDEAARRNLERELNRLRQVEEGCG